MKYSPPVTLLMVVLFLLAQVIGLAFVLGDIEDVVQGPDGPIIVHPDTALGERPELEGVDTVVYMLSGVLIGTGLILLIMRFAKVIIWKVMFFVAVTSTITVALGVYLPDWAALGIALVFAVWKLVRPNPLVHNLSELLIYAGIAVLFVPLLDTFWAIVLLGIIAVYDAIAVWKTRHMVALAMFQTKSKVFAGLAIGAGEDMKPQKTKKGGENNEQRQAILGGGDIAFPLIFTGTVMETLIPIVGRESAFLQALIIPIVLAIVIFTLLWKGEQGKFYPAMPFLTAGCLLGWGIIALLGAI